MVIRLDPLLNPLSFGYKVIAAMDILLLHTSHFLHTMPVFKRG